MSSHKKKQPAGCIFYEHILTYCSRALSHYLQRPLRKSPFYYIAFVVEHFIHARPPSAFFFLRPIAMYVLSLGMGSGAKFYHQT